MTNSNRPNFLIDTEAANKRLAAEANNPFRWKIGSFRMPKDASKAQIKTRAADLSYKFVDVLKKQGWEQATPFHTVGPIPTAFDIRDSAKAPDEYEWQIRAV